MSAVYAGDTLIISEPGSTSNYVRFYESVEFIVNSTLDLPDQVLGDRAVDAGGGLITLRAAIQEANALGVPTRIVLPAGTYELDITGSDDAAAAGDLDILTDITIVGAGMGLSVIDASGITDRVFHVLAGHSLDVSALTVTGADTSAEGAGFYVYRGDLSLDQVAVINNRTTNSVGGGGILNKQGNLDVVDSVFAYNDTTANLGAIIRTWGATGFAATTTLSGNVFAKNTQSGGDLQGQIAHSVTGSTTSLGGNVSDSAGRDFANWPNNILVHATDYVDASGPDHVVTSLVDTFRTTPDINRLSLREAVDLANDSVSTPEEIWLPAWTFLLTRTGSDTGSPNVSLGDIDILDDLTILGIDDSETTVDATFIVDNVFEEIGTATLTDDRFTIING